jgi:hypothetical protein
MSKKKDKDNKNEVPIDFQVESKNLQYTITLREIEISDLKAEVEAKKNYIINLESEIHNLKGACVNGFKIQNDLKIYKSKCEKLEKEIDDLKEAAIKQQAKFDEEKRTIENNHLNEINQLKLSIEASSQKIELANQILNENEKLKKDLENLQKEKATIIFNNNEVMRQKEVKNQIKFSNLKKKMMDNINQTQSKVTELNIQYMDVSTKLTLLQNHQLLIQLEYQSQQIEELTNKKQTLEKKIFELNKDIEIHKEVELSLAEKNKKLKSENLKLKNNGNNENNKSNNDSLVINNVSINNLSLNNNNNLDNNNYKRILNLEKKIYNLEKKLSQKNKDYINLKENAEYIETRLKNYEKKYAGLFNFFEDSLQNFFDDDEIKNNQEIYVNIDALQKCDFNAFSKEEKYTILVILMKYLLPLINSNDSISKNNIGNVNLKFHYNNNSKFYDNEDLKKFANSSNSQRVNKSEVLNSKKGNSIQNTYDSLPSIKKSTNNNNPAGMIFD